MSWLKFDLSTPEKTEVLAITVALGWDDPDLTVGKLLKVWRWFDQHTVEGNAPSVTTALLDRIVGVTGMSDAMIAVGWLVKSGAGLQLPNFDRHNGKTTKDRLLTAKRVASHKGNAKGNATTVTEPLAEPLPREEKRREEEPTVLVDAKPSTPAGPISIDRVDCPMQAIADAWNEIAVSMPAVKPVAEWADARKRMVKARWVDKLKLKKYTDRTTGIDYWTRLFARVESSDFLAGRGGGTFTATLDWVMNPTNLAKIIENGYPNRQAVTA